MGRAGRCAPLRRARPGAAPPGTAEAPGTRRVTSRPAVSRANDPEELLGTKDPVPGDGGGSGPCSQDRLRCEGWKERPSRPPHPRPLSTSHSPRCSTPAPAPSSPARSSTSLSPPQTPARPSDPHPPQNDPPHPKNCPEGPPTKTCPSRTAARAPHCSPGIAPLSPKPPLGDGPVTSPPRGSPPRS